MLKIETINETVCLEINALDLTKHVLKTELAEFKTSVELEFDNVGEAISLKADKAYVDEEISKIEIPSLTGYATEVYVDNKFNSLDLSDYATQAYVNDKINAIPEVDLGSYATKVYVQDEIEKIEIPSLIGYATESYVDNKIDAIDLSGYALKSDLSSEIDTINIELDKKADKSDLVGLATETYVDQKVDSIDLSSYATTQYVDNELNLKADKSQLEGLATEDYVKEQIKDIPQSDINVVQTTGSSTTDVMSQKAVSDSLKKKISFGDYGLAGARDLRKTDIDYSKPSAFYSSGLNSGLVVPRNLGVNAAGVGNMIIAGNFQNLSAHSTINFLLLSQNGLATGYSKLREDEWEVYDVYDTNNVTTDINGYLNTSKNPIPTLTTSDMADTVVNNETMTVTSGAVYRAIKKLTDQVEELQKKIDDLYHFVDFSEMGK